MDIHHRTNPSESVNALIHDAERRESMLQRLKHERNRLSRLPKESLYVAHRLRVVDRAMQILSPSNGTFEEGNADEVSALLASLSL